MPCGKIYLLEMSFVPTENKMACLLVSPGPHPVPAHLCSHPPPLQLDLGDAAAQSV